MLKIGITGGIGSGKTTVCRLFEIFGIPVFYADLVAREVMHSDELLREGVSKTFGPESYSTEGILDRRRLANIVFADSSALARLNALVHPAVFRAFDTWVQNQKNAPYILKEAALLFESGSYKMCDYNILVKSPEVMKIQRVMDRDHISKDEVLLRMSKQFSDDQKEKLADFMIENNEQQLIIPQVLALHEQFISMNSPVA